MHRKNRQLRLGIIGCGAVTKRGHLPALKNISLYKLEMLVNEDENIVKNLCQRYKVPKYSTDFRDCFDKIDAAIVALPHHLHANVSIGLLQHGIHVLCEKPIAMSYLQACKMLKAAAQNSSILSVNYVRRFYWSSRKVKEIIQSRDLGPPLSIICEEGSTYEWPTVSGFFFNPKYAGGGVTIDTGAHLFDMLLWWLGEYPTKIDYKDDNFGGVEAESEAKFLFSSGVEARIRMSRLVPLKNSYELIFEKGKIIYFLGNFNKIMISKDNISTSVYSPKRNSFISYFRMMLEDFALSIIENRQPFITAKEAVECTKLIKQCYATKKEMVKPWLKTN